jgi:hypothetical protein
MLLVFLFILYTTAVNGLDLECYTCITCARLKWQHLGCQQLRTYCDGSCFKIFRSNNIDPAFYSDITKIIGENV